ncbi:MAG: hypothetical protein F4103_11855 [Boseongicola sp. SB0673_bin_14]|nr:hypothetical protein [Boseongicola sp. SB0673_bin_14]
MQRAFLSTKTSRLRIRSVQLWSENHVRAHVFMCMLACHLDWHMRGRLAPLLFKNDDREGARAQRSSPVEPAPLCPERLIRNVTRNSLACSTTQ